MKLHNYISDLNAILIYYEGDSYIGPCNNMHHIQFSSKFHNINGPSIICANGELEYWINNIYVGKDLSNKEFEQKVKECIFK